MEGGSADRRFGFAWLAFALAVGVHVTDEAMNDFLSIYNPAVLAIREKFPLLPLPTFTFPVWLGGLVAGIALLLCLTPLAVRGNTVLRLVALPLAVVVGVFNALGHIAGSIYMQRRMPGVYSSPLLLAAAVWLLVTARAKAAFHSSVA
jgi:hypothetical protein